MKPRDKPSGGGVPLCYLRTIQVGLQRLARLDFVLAARGLGGHAFPHFRPQGRRPALWGPGQKIVPCSGSVVEVAKAEIRMISTLVTLLK
jgi:hypothetical protein